MSTKDKKKMGEGFKIKRKPWPHGTTFFFLAPECPRSELRCHVLTGMLATTRVSMSVHSCLRQHENVAGRQRIRMEAPGKALLSQSHA